MAYIGKYIRQNNILEENRGEEERAYEETLSNLREFLRYLEEKQIINCMQLEDFERSRRSKFSRLRRRKKEEPAQSSERTLLARWLSLPASRVSRVLRTRKISRLRTGPLDQRTCATTPLATCFRKRLVPTKAPLAGKSLRFCSHPKWGRSRRSRSRSPHPQRRETPWRGLREAALDAVAIRQ